jgi:hypothetical protein
MLQRRRLKILDKRRFFREAMTELAGSAYVSFEGNLSSLSLSKIRGASGEETSTLKRNTIWPKQDFIVLPLEAELTKEISSAIGGTIPKAILHIQIEKRGKLELGIYDNFQHVGCGEALEAKFLEQLQSDGIVKLNEVI